MLYSETPIWKIHLNGADWHISPEEYKQIYTLLEGIWVKESVSMSDILSCLCIVRFGWDIGEKAKDAPDFESTHNTIKLQIFKICELSHKFSCINNDL